MMLVLKDDLFISCRGWRKTTMLLRIRFIAINLQKLAQTLRWPRADEAKELAEDFAGDLLMPNLGAPLEEIDGALPREEGGRHHPTLTAHLRFNLSPT